MGWGKGRSDCTDPGGRRWGGLKSWRDGDIFMRYLGDRVTTTLLMDQSGERAPCRVSCRAGRAQCNMKPQGPSEGGALGGCRSRWHTKPALGS